MGKAIFRINERLLLDLFTVGRHEGYEVIEGAIPKDATVKDVRTNLFAGNDIEICVESPELPENDPTLRLPNICPTTRRLPGYSERGFGPDPEEDDDKSDTELP